MNVTDDELTFILEAVGWALKSGTVRRLSGLFRRKFWGAEGQGWGLTTTHPVRTAPKCKATLFNDRLSFRRGGKPRRQGRTADV